MFSKLDLSYIKKHHIEEAAMIIDTNGIPRNYLENQYWFVINNREYPFKYVIRIADQIVTKSEGWRDFSSLPIIRNYFEKILGFSLNYYPNWSNFFKPAEIELFSTVLNKKYQKKSERDQILGRKILPLFSKTAVWAKSLNIEGFKIQTDFKWQISGHFKPYTWARIFRKGDEDKNIFFTVGVDTKQKALIYKLDCLWSQTNKNKALAPDKVERFRKFVQGTNTNMISISLDQIDDYNWDRLIIETKRFIEKNIQVYDDVIEYVWKNKKPLVVVENRNELRPQKSPLKGFKETPNRNPLFKGVNKDFIKESVRNKAFGDAGEQLVIAYERLQLYKVGLSKLAEQVQKVSDGKGYDILSYFPDRKQKFIEVKTTTSGKLKPFPISWNEIEYMKRFHGNYFLYRVYNFDPVSNSADFFVLENNVLEQLLLRELNYEAFIKTID